MVMRLGAIALTGWRDWARLDAKFARQGDAIWNMSGLGAAG